MDNVGRQGRNLGSVELQLQEIVRSAVREELAEVCRQLESLSRELQKIVSFAAAPPKAFLTTAQAAVVAEVTPKTIRAWIKRYRLDASLPGASRQYRIKTSELMEFLESRERRGVPDANAQVEKILAARREKKKG